MNYQEYEKLNDEFNKKLESFKSLLEHVESAKSSLENTKKKLDEERNKITFPVGCPMFRYKKNNPESYSGWYVLIQKSFGAKSEICLMNMHTQHLWTNTIIVHNYNPGEKINQISYEKMNELTGGYAKYFEKGLVVNPKTHLISKI